MGGFTYISKEITKAIFIITYRVPLNMIKKDNFNYVLSKEYPSHELL